MALASIVYPTNEKDPFWSDSARNLFVGLGLLVLETPRLPKTFGEILRQGSGKGQQTAEYLAQIIQARKRSDTPLSSTCHDALNRFLNNSENTLKSILASFVAPLSPFRETLKKTSRFWQNTRIPPAEFPHEADDLR